MFDRLHARLGDFWWYSLMLFCACRAADLLNAFIGLWLVPKYVGTSELGAVMPLTSFAGFIALPVSIFATAFMTEITVLATHGEYGKMKSLMRGVFICAGIFLILALLTTRLALPAFLTRIRVGEGSLGILIVSTAFVGAIAPIYSSALQALKRFTTVSFLNIISAPIRFAVMLIAMPFRAISGYFVGQAALPTFSIVASIWVLRKELSVPAEPYWNRQVFRNFSVMLLGIGAYCYAGNILGLAEQTILRQRLPDIDSAAYYMATRLSDIAAFVVCTLTTVLFPFTASLAAEGKSTRHLVVKSSLATLAIGTLLALTFAVTGRSILALLPDGDKYAEYAWAIPWLICITSISAVQAFHTNTEVSAGRFSFLKWWVPLHLIFIAGLLLVTGYGYFTTYLPESWCDFLAHHNFTSLTAMMVWFSVTSLAKAIASLVELMRQN